MIPRQSIAPGYGGMSSVDMSVAGSSKQGESGNQGGQQSFQPQQQRMSSSGKQGVGGSSKQKAVVQGSSSKKTQGVAGGFN